MNSSGEAGQATSTNEHAAVHGRRTVLGTGAAIAVALAAGCLDDGDGEPTDPGDDSEDDGETADEPPFEIETIDARGSEHGTITVPEDGIVQVLNFARTECPTSEGETETIADAKSAVTDDRVRFVTINNWTRGPAETEAELAEWWDEETVGDWTLGIDEAGAASDHYEIRAFPTTIVIDDDGAVHARGTSDLGRNDITDGVEDALEATTNTE